MTFERKSRNAFLALTMVTVLAIVSLLAVYAVIIGTFQGGEVTVGGVGDSTITYNADNNATETWTTTLTASSTSSTWYSRLEINAGDYSGPVTIVWQLQQKNGTDSWTDVTGANTTTSITLSGIPENIYASSNGSYTNNRDWGLDVIEAGTYRVVVDVESA